MDYRHWRAEELRKMGVGVQRISSSGEIICRCPFHDDRRPSFSVNAEKGLWICYRGCGSGTWEDLLERLGYGDYIEVDDRIDGWRGLSNSTIKRWGLRYDEDLDAVEIPVRDLRGEVIGTIWRKLSGTPKYLNSPGLKKKEILFGLRESIEDFGINAVRNGLHIVEGPLDAIWVHSLDFPVSAILGGTMSRSQLDILLTLDVHRVILLLDNDEVGKSETRRLTSLLRELGIWVKNVELPKEYKDIQEVPPEKAKELLTYATNYSTIPSYLKRWI